MEWNLTNHAIDLEEQFFANQDAELVAKLKAELKAKEAKTALASASGIKDPAVIDELFELGINPTTLAALSLVPLVEVAWADLELDKREKGAILKAAAEKEITPGTASYSLLENWLKAKPDKAFRKAWTDYVHALCQNLSAENKDSFKKEILESAYFVAKASGGFLGMIEKISSAEERVLSELEAAFT